MTGFVYETQHLTNPAISNYVDALYFTVTALTTTGFGDITLPGTTSRLISIVIMIFGVTLFLGLARAVLRPELSPNLGDGGDQAAAA
jgi:voltage-gated potassium channel